MRSRQSGSRREFVRLFSTSPVVIAGSLIIFLILGTLGFLPALTGKGDPIMIIMGGVLGMGGLWVFLRFSFKPVLSAIFPELHAVGKALQPPRFGGITSGLASKRSPLPLGSGPEPELATPPQAGAQPQDSVITPPQIAR